MCLSEGAEGGSINYVYDELHDQRMTLDASMEDRYGLKNVSGRT